MYMYIDVQISNIQYVKWPFQGIQPYWQGIQPYWQLMQTFQTFQWKKFKTRTSNTYESLVLVIFVLHFVPVNSSLPDWLLIEILT